MAVSARVQARLSKIQGQDVQGRGKGGARYDKIVFGWARQVARSPPWGGGGGSILRHQNCPIGEILKIPARRKLSGWEVRRQPVNQHSVEPLVSPEAPPPRALCSAALVVCQGAIGEKCQTFQLRGKFWGCTGMPISLVEKAGKRD